MENRLQIAIQKSGRLTDHSLDLLTRCGLKYTRSRDQLLCFGENMPIDALLVRDDDIPGLVAEGICQLGIAGQNVFSEKRLSTLEALSSAEAPGNAAPTSDLSAADTAAEFAATELAALDFGHCRLMTAGPRELEYTGPAMLQGKRLATTYPGILRDYLRREGIDASVVEFSGSVEIAPRLGKADFICDLVSSGATLAANQLSPWETVFDSEAVLIGHTGPMEADSQAWIDRLVQRVHGVLAVRESKYIMLHAPRDNLEAVTSLLPGSEFPTILPIEGVDDKVVIHAVCRENVFWETLESLKAAGASSILVLPVEKMLA